MIADAADYRFVDFANGDLPTGRFDGGVMPLRQGDAQDVMRAEDVAMLIECVRDKTGAFKDLAFPSSGVTPSGTTPPSVAPTKKISSSQMSGIRSYLGQWLQRGFFGSGVGFLRDPLAEATAIESLEDGYVVLERTGATMQAIETAHGGTWAESTAAADFAAGTKVAKAPVLGLFSDASNLVMPVYSYRFGEPFFDTSSATLEKVYSEGGPVTTDYTFGYFVDSPVGAPFALTSRVRSDLTPVVARVADDYISDAKLWLAYSAYTWYTTRSPFETKMYSKTGLIRLDAAGGGTSSLISRTHANGVFEWKTSGPMSQFLLDRIVSDCGWAKFSTSQVSWQRLVPLFDSCLIVEATPSGRTQWW